MITVTENIRLSLSLYPIPSGGSLTSCILNKLWDELRGTSVDALQSSTPSLYSFADECLLCALIFGRLPPSPEEDHSIQGHMVPLQQQLEELEEPVGIVYATATPANSLAKEVNIGVVMDEKHRRKGYARDAVGIVLRWAFEEVGFHRVQAAVMDTPGKDRPLRLFTGLGFGHEGTRRRSAYCPEEGIVGGWRDVTYLALLDTEWVLRGFLKLGPVDVWDEMFARHAREREELVNWEEKHKRVRRVSSTETVRDGEQPPSNEGRPDSGLPTFFWSSASSSSSCQSSDYGSVPSSPSPHPSTDMETDDEMDLFRDVPNCAPLITQSALLGVPPLLSVSRSPASSFDPRSARLSMLRTIPSSSEASAQTPISIPPSSPSPSISSSLGSEIEDEPSPAPSMLSNEHHWERMRDSVMRRFGSSSSGSSRRSHARSSPSSSQRSRPPSDVWSDAESVNIASGSEWDILDSSGSSQSGSESGSPRGLGIAL
ncbi:hypothetical protein BV22DRAFT_1033092 [Leucogyrophana mollusca]|uniref:Uncharacterized protein n=1 Tax=Leucogyrophana mollusca TaxID=85980 RepID=A0ACB8BL06_9AGAM|nr:hypothetical protein BV22DRAFT_1033092 [Leucogyrophana mollusca]